MQRIRMLRERQKELDRHLPDSSHSLHGWNELPPPTAWWAVRRYACAKVRDPGRCCLWPASLKGRTPRERKAAFSGLPGAGDRQGWLQQTLLPSTCLHIFPSLTEGSCSSSPFCLGQLYLVFTCRRTGSAWPSVLPKLFHLPPGNEKPGVWPLFLWFCDDSSQMRQQSLVSFFLSFKIF